MSFLHEETEEMFETSQQIDALREVIVSDLENESLSVTVHAKHILQGCANTPWSIVTTSSYSRVNNKHEPARITT